MSVSSNGPTDQEIEDDEIDRAIERSEEALRGEHGEEAKREEEARLVAYDAARRKRDEEELRKLEKDLGSHALAKACTDSFDYALKLKSGEVIRFQEATWHGNGWLTLGGIIDGSDDDDRKLREVPGLPYPADRGVDVRLEEILWVMDAPCGS
jgi:hypothetical protein